MYLALAAADSREALQSELQQQLIPETVREISAGLFAWEARSSAERLPQIAFASQLLPDAVAVGAATVRAWAAVVVEAIAGVLPDDEPWSLHVYPLEEQHGGARMGARAWHSRARAGDLPLPRHPAQPASLAGKRRCELIVEACRELLHKRRRHLARSMREHHGPFWVRESLVQLLLIGPEAGYLSVALAPTPVEQRHVISPFPGGDVPLAVDKGAPSRAFAKLVEAETRLGRRIAARETCVDLGAAPGSWTYVAVRRGARVTAVDRAELRTDLMEHPNVLFERGDAFRFDPGATVDWLLCDVIASADRSAELLLRWLREVRCRNFVVTLKVDDSGSTAALAELKRALPALTSELTLRRLSANKKEVCAFGVARIPADGSAPPA